MGRCDLSHDNDLPVPYGLPDSRVSALDDEGRVVDLARTFF